MEASSDNGNGPNDKGAEENASNAPSDGAAGTDDGANVSISL